MKIEVFNLKDELYDHVAHSVAQYISRSSRVVLGLAAGNTPTPLYQRLTAKHSAGELSFANTTTFNLDEFYGIPHTHPGSFASYTKKTLLDHVDIKRENTHFLNGLARSAADECKDYENKIQKSGGIDLLILGLGQNGHIAFNEPLTPIDSRTRLVTLTEASREANQDRFPNEETPREALTMGLATILNAKKIMLIATGKSKKKAVQNCFREKPSLEWPGSCLQTHKYVSVFIDIDC